MPVKVYISGISGNKEVKKRQQRVMMIMDSRNIKYEVVDITEPGNEGDKDFMQNNSTSLGGTVSDTNPRHPLPPQLFNDTTYCGDYDQFDLANEIDELEKFLKLEPNEPTQQITSTAEVKLGNGKPETNDNEDAQTQEETQDSAETAPEAAVVNGTEENEGKEDAEEEEEED